MDYPVILHVLSYNDEHLCMLISKSLQVYKIGEKKFPKLPISLLLKANIYREFQDVLWHNRFKKFRPRICTLAASLGNLSALQWLRNPERLVHPPPIKVVRHRLLTITGFHSLQFLNKIGKSAVPGIRRHVLVQPLTVILLCCSG